MIYIRCPSCGSFIGNRQYEYDQQVKEIESDPKLDNDEKNKKKTDVINSLGLQNYCCKMRVITYIDLTTVIN